MQNDFPTELSSVGLNENNVQTWVKRLRKSMSSASGGRHAKSNHQQNMIGDAQKVLPKGTP